jgi:hypothetical protein
MNAKRKAKVQETGDDQLTDDENAAASAQGLDADKTGDPLAANAEPLAADAQRPGQAPNRDDPTDANFRASQGTGAGTASGTWKPAEPTAVMDGPDIPQIPLAEAKPGYETVNSSRVPGMGDPQNGVVLDDWTQSPIAWVNPQWPTHQPNDGPNAVAVPDPDALPEGTDPDDEAQAQALAHAPGAPGKDVGPLSFDDATSATGDTTEGGKYSANIFPPNDQANDQTNE